MQIEKCGNWLFRWRGRLLIPFVSLLFVFLKPQYPMGSHWLDEVTDIIGYLIMLGGLALRFWVVGYRKSGTSGRSREIKTGELITDGAYAFVRNPLYLANTIIAFGFVIIFWTPWLFLAFPAYLLYYHLIIRAEEAYLTREFGGVYLGYKQRTPRLIPAIWRKKCNSPSRKFQWNQVMRKEKDLILGVILGPIMIEIYEDILHQGWRQVLKEDLGELAVFSLVAASILSLWLVVTRQKKRRIL